VTRRAYAAWLLDTGGDARLAAAEAARAVELDPTDAKAHLVRGRAQLQLGLEQHALTHFRKAANLDREDPAAALALKQLYHRMGKPREAEEWSRRYLARQQSAEEIRELDQEINARPTDRSLHRRMARLLARKGDVAGCLRHHAAALRSAADAPPTLIAAANDLSAEGYAGEALPLARRAVSLADANPAAHEAIGNAFLGLGQWHLAGRHYNKAAGWLPERTPELKERLRRFLEKRAANPPPAELAYRKAVALEGQMVGPKRVTEETETLAKRAVELEPTDPVYLNYLLKVQMAQRKSVEALATVDRLLELVPDDARAHALRAVLLIEQATAEPDLKTIEADIKAAASNATVAATRHYAEGLLALHRKDAAAAVRALRRTVELDPHTDVTYYKLFQAERLAGNTAAAERALAEFNRREERKRLQTAVLGDIAREPHNPTRYHRAIRVFEQHGLRPQAAAIRAEAERRFKSRRSSKASPPSSPPG
jgi:tetratricopeptide (TPR) repeat protein